MKSLKNLLAVAALFCTAMVFAEIKTVDVEALKADAKAAVADAKADVEAVAERRKCPRNSAN